MQIKKNGPNYKLEKDMTLADLEKQLKMKGESKKDVKFYAPDGAFISKGTSFSHMMHIPYFVMKIDGEKEYNILSEKSFSLRNTKFALTPNEKPIYDQCKILGMRD